jgi:hypothetical protein
MFLAGMLLCASCRSGDLRLPRHDFGDSTSPPKRKDLQDDVVFVLAPRLSPALPRYKKDTRVFVYDDASKGRSKYYVPTHRLTRWIYDGLVGYLRQLGYVVEVSDQVPPKGTALAMSLQEMFVTRRGADQHARVALRVTVYRDGEVAAEFRVSDTAKPRPGAQGPAYQLRGAFHGCLEAAVTRFESMGAASG